MDWIVRHWYVWVLVLGVGIAIAIGRSAGPTPDEAAPAADSNQDALRARFDSALSDRQAINSEAVERTTDVIIAEHEARLVELEQAPAPDESAALLSALGNLHKQKKRDNATAARYYEELIQKYPDWPGVNAIYHQLISCYTELDDQPRLRMLYRKMTEVFPDDSKEYEYASAALAGEL